MAVIGVDFGGSRLRVAAPRGGGAELVPHVFATDQMPRVINVESAPGGGPLRVRISSLKRLLDFDKSLPLPPTGVGSLEYLAKILEHVRVEYRRGSEGEEVNCVLAVPPCFSQRQRSALRSAAVGAGFARVRLVDDTLAALLASRKAVEGSERVLAYSWGASAFSAALYQAKGASYQVVAQEGNRESGGDDLDALVVESLLEGLRNGRGGLAAHGDNEFAARLVDEAERLKLALSHGERAEPRLDGPRAGGLRPGALSPEEFERGVARMTEETLALTEKVLAADGGAAPQVVLTAGGMTLVPAVREALAARLGLPLVQADASAVALGAALLGQSIAQTEWDKQERAKGDAPRPHDAAPAPPPQPARAAAPPTPANGWAGHFVPLIDSAQRQFEAGEIVEAVNTFEKLFAELAKFSGNIYMRAATSLRSAKKPDAALDILRRANRRDPANRVIAIDLAQNLFRVAAQSLQDKHGADALRQVEPAIAALRAVPREAADNHELLAQLLHLKGCALYQTRRLAEAEGAVAESVRLDAKNPQYARDLETIRQALARAEPAKPTPDPRRKVGRNETCPCGSGRKFKKCCASKS